MSHRSQSGSSSLTVLLVSHSGRHCSAGTLLYHCARCLRRSGATVRVTFPREAPGETVFDGYASIGASIVSLDNRGYDLVIANTQASAAAIVDLGDPPPAPIVFWLHEGWQHRDPSLMHQAMERVSAVLLQTPYQRDVVYRKFLERRSVPIFFVPYGIATFDPTSSQYDQKRRPRIVSIGAVQPRKRHSDLIHALHGISRDVECFIVGAWKESCADTLALAGADSERFHLTGHVENAVARAIARSADIVAHPSESESQPIAILEAMYFARPLVVADLETYRYQHLEHGVNCLMYPVGDVERLRECIVTLLDDRTLGDRLGAAARRAFDAHFRLEQFEARISTAIETLTDTLCAGTR